MIEVNQILQEVDLLVQNVQNIAMERDVANLNVQLAQEEIINLRTNLDSVTIERDAALISQNALNNTLNQNLINLITALQVQGKDAVSLQGQALTILEKCKLSLENSLNRTVELEKQLLALN
jgi:hypothetical protein